MVSVVIVSARAISVSSMSVSGPMVSISVSKVLLWCIWFMSNSEILSGSSFNSSFCAILNVLSILSPATFRRLGSLWSSSVACEFLYSCLSSTTTSIDLQLCDAMRFSGVVSKCGRSKEEKRDEEKRKKKGEKEEKGGKCQID